MTKNLALAVLLALCVLLAVRLVQTENERYALEVGLCRDEAQFGLPTDFECLSTVQTRTSWTWHLYYALSR